MFLDTDSAMLPKLICCFTKTPLCDWTCSPAQPPPACEWQRGALCSPGWAAPGVSGGGAEQEVCAPFLHAGITLSCLGERRSKCSLCSFSGLWVSVFCPQNTGDCSQFALKLPSSQGGFFPFVSLQAWLPDGWEQKSEGCSEGECDSQRGGFLTASSHSRGSEGWVCRGCSAPHTKELIQIFPLLWAAEQGQSPGTSVILQPQIVSLLQHLQERMRSRDEI